ncbi:MAG: thymidine phosphorylase, partial [Lachnospiraceae bacterium]|nr:thymidine phosphorylase [Lachnospiraceae bacterium]
MRMYDLITKKRDGQVLEDAEIRYIVEGFTKGDIPDYQMSAFLMAVFYEGMNDDEILSLTTAMAESGDMADLSPIEGIK